MRKIKSEGLSEVKKEDHLKFRTLREFGTLSGLSELKGDEIVEFELSKSSELYDFISLQFLY
ncbi:MAG: hypothetical protein IPP79_16630 [Chitinophagaceae bacterium]|nr:hypothetical protein [Chitinophagaceae bacterium]